MRNSVLMVMAIFSVCFLSIDVLSEEPVTAETLALTAGENVLVQANLTGYPTLNIKFDRVNQDGTLRVERVAAPEHFDAALPIYLPLVEFDPTHIRLTVDGNGQNVFGQNVEVCYIYSGLPLSGFQLASMVRVLQWKPNGNKIEDITSEFLPSGSYLCGKIKSFDGNSGETITLAAGEFSFTPEGNDILVGTIGAPGPDVRTIPLYIRYDRVNSMGATSSSLSFRELSFPAGFVRAEGQNWWVQYMIETSAKTVGGGTVCIPFIGTEPEADYRLFYAVNNQTKVKLMSAGASQEFPDPYSTTGGPYSTICGRMPSFGSGSATFVVGKRLAPQ